MKTRIAAAIVVVTVIAVGGEVGYGPAVQRDLHAAGKPIIAVALGAGVSGPMRRTRSPLSPEMWATSRPSSKWPALVLSSSDNRVMDLSLGAHGRMTRHVRVVLAHVTRTDSVSVEFFDVRGASLGRVSHLTSGGEGDVAFASAEADAAHPIARIRITSLGRALGLGDHHPDASDTAVVVVRDLVCDGTTRIGG